LVELKIKIIKRENKHHHKTA
ncbi:unnamed protein product, partial [Rotaria magnacalcarata]